METWKSDAFLQLRWQKIVRIDFIAIVNSKKEGIMWQKRNPCMIDSWTREGYTAKKPCSMFVSQSQILDRIRREGVTWRDIQLRWHLGVGTANIIAVECARNYHHSVSCVKWSRVGNYIGLGCRSALHVWLSVGTVPCVCCPNDRSQFGHECNVLILLFEGINLLKTGCVVLTTEIYSYNLFICEKYAQT